MPGKEMKTTIVLFALVTFLLLNCEVQKEEMGTRVEVMPIDSIDLPDTVSAGQKITFDAVVSTPNPCWRFHHFDISQNDKEVTIRAHAEYDGEPCQQVVSTFEAMGSLAFAEPGIYTIKLERPERGMLEQTVVVE